MKKKNNNKAAFLALLSAGLWRTNCNLSIYGSVDFKEIYRLAEEQSVIGIVADGIEHVQDVSVPKEIVLQLIGATLQIEERNKAMNVFSVDLIKKMRAAGIYSLLLKGQGVALCYEQPLWRACGDVDLFLSDDNYPKAFNFLSTMAQVIEEEGIYSKHVGMAINNWEVELHGTLRCGLSHRTDHVLDEIYTDTFNNGNVSSCMMEKTQVFMLGIENNVVYVFAHILQHFFKGGVGLRQICDWCRLLKVYNGRLDINKLSNRLHKMGLLSEWKAFAALAVTQLGLDERIIPFYSADKRWKRDAYKIIHLIFKSGNMGHNRDLSYQYKSYPIKRKLITFCRLTKEAIHICAVFPLDTLKFWSFMMLRGFMSLLQQNK